MAYFNAGQRLTAALLEPLAVAITPPMAVLTRAIAQSISNAAVTPDAISWDTVTKDSAGGFAAGNPTRYTAQRAGWYQLSGGVGFAANATGIRTAQFTKNGTSIVGTQTKLLAVSGGIVTAVPAWTVQVELAIGDYVELRAFQNSGAGLNTSTETENRPTMHVRWVSL